MISNQQVTLKEGVATITFTVSGSPGYLLIGKNRALQPIEVIPAPTGGTLNGSHSLTFPAVAGDKFEVGDTPAVTDWVEVEVKPSPTPPPPPEPPVSGATIIGLNAGNWGSQALPDITGTGVRGIRLPHGLLSEAPKYKAAGYKVCGIFGEGGTIGSINKTAYAEEVVKLCAQYELDAMEVLNEPGGSWFWSDPTNYSAYVALCKATYEAVRKAGLKTDVIASWDGGQAGSVSFGEHIKALGVLEWCDGVSAHPYGGASGGAGGKALDRRKCETAIAQSGKPLHVTEAGLPTGTGPTGDSQAWTLGQQAEGLGSFAAFCMANPKIVALYWYGYKNSSDSGAAQYGVEYHDNWNHKPAFGVLGEAAKKANSGEVELGCVEQLEKYAETIEEHSWGQGEKPTPYEVAMAGAGADEE